MHDSEVAAAIVAGDPDGLAEAYDRYAAPLYTYCRSLLREPADAADAVQDTFVIAASKLAGLRDQSRLRPWLYAVARNECHRRLRDKANAATSALDQVPEMSDESEAIRSAFAAGLNDLLIVTAALAFTGAVCALVLIRPKDFVLTGRTQPPGGSSARTGTGADSTSPARSA